MSSVPLSLRVWVLAVAAVITVASLTGCMTVQVNMPGSPTAAATSAKGTAAGTKLTASQARAAHLEQLRASVTDAARAKAAALTKRWIQVIKATDTSLVRDPAGVQFAAVTVKIPGMDMALFVYRLDGSRWELLGYCARKQASAVHALYGVPTSVWKALLG